MNESPKFYGEKVTSVLRIRVRMSTCFNAYFTPIFIKWRLPQEFEYLRLGKGAERTEKIGIWDSENCLKKYLFFDLKCPRLRLFLSDGTKNRLGVNKRLKDRRDESHHDHHLPVFRPAPWARMRDLITFRGKIFGFSLVFRGYWITFGSKGFTFLSK